MQIQASWEFGLLHFYPAIFYIISHSLHLSLRFNILGENIYCYYWDKCAKVAVRVDLLAPRSCAPFTRAIPKGPPVILHNNKSTASEFLSDALFVGGAADPLSAAQDLVDPAHKKAGGVDSKGECIVENHRTIIGKHI